MKNHVFLHENRLKMCLKVYREEGERKKKTQNKEGNHAGKRVLGNGGKDEKKENFEYADW
jgi:hypothetical protein